MRSDRHNSRNTTESAVGARTETEVVRKFPRPHQTQAIQDIGLALKKPGRDVRTTCVMACGTGKTLVGLWASEELGARTLLTEPSLALIAQNLREWRASYRGEKPQFLVVCSDQTTVRLNADEPLVRKEDLDCNITNNPDEIAAFLRDGNSRKILISTNHSLPLVSDAMSRKGISPFDCTVVDEAHRTATREDSVFSLVLDPSAIRSRTRLFLTATPRLFLSDLTPNGERIVSMDDEKVFGSRSHTLSFSKAIQAGLLTDYQLVVAAISEKEESELQRIAGSEREYRYALAELALLRASKKYGFSKVITFHGTVRRARDLANRLEYSASRFSSDQKIWVHAVDGKMPTLTRNHLLQLFREQPRKTLSVMANCQCLKEGVDVPALDCVAFFDKKESEIDIIQGVGRAMRLSPTKQLGTILIPVVVPHNADGDRILESSEFNKVWQVIRALKTLDDRFAVRCKALDRSTRDKSDADIEEDSDQGVTLDIDALPAGLRARLTTKVIDLGTSIKKDPLTEDKILSWADDHHAKTGSYPDQYAGEVLAAPGETWVAVNGALRNGNRGLPGGSSLIRLLEDTGRIEVNKDWSQNQITKWGAAYLKRTGSLPTAATGIIDEFPSRTWAAVDAAFRAGSKGLPKVGGLSSFWKQSGLKAKEAEVKAANFLDTEDILKWADHEKENTGRYPTKRSGSVLASPQETWPRIDECFRNSSRGLSGYRSLAHFLGDHGRSNRKGRYGR